MEKKQIIAIIGSGISGLLACKHVVERGLSPIVFEARPSIGGVWAQTMSSTKLQTPKHYYRFSDFEWPSSVTGDFPDHNQVIEYIKSYAAHFDLNRWIKFGMMVVGIEYSPPLDEDERRSWCLWGGTGGPFSCIGNWKVMVQDAQDPSAPLQVDFVIMCIGKFSDLPNIPNFPLGKGPEVFKGHVIHSMDYASMDDDRAAQFISGKRIAVIGFQKSAVDLAAEIANQNGPRNPCTLIFKTVHWTVSEKLLKINFRNLNRLSEFTIHKPGEGFFSWLLTLLLHPFLWIYSKLMETYLKWIYPLKKFNMVPQHGFLQQISSCMFTVLPSKFYDRVEEKSIILHKTKSFNFCENGIIIKNRDSPIEVDIVIFATGYRSDDKLKNIFVSKYFQKVITGSSPFYRECIHPQVPQLAILGYSESPSMLYTTEMRTKWLAHFLDGKIELPKIKEMENEVNQWENCMRVYANEGFKKACVNVLLQIHCNDQICKDMGVNPMRKNRFFSELFDPYGPSDYVDLCN